MHPQPRCHLAHRERRRSPSPLEAAGQGQLRGPPVLGTDSPHARPLLPSCRPWHAPRDRKPERDDVGMRLTPRRPQSLCQTVSSAAGLASVLRSWLGEVLRRRRGQPWEQLVHIYRGWWGARGCNDRVAAINGDATCPLGGRSGPPRAGVGRGSPWKGREAAPRRGAEGTEAWTRARGRAPTQDGALSREVEMRKHKEPHVPQTCALTSITC